MNIRNSLLAAVLMLAAPVALADQAGAPAGEHHHQMHRHMCGDIDANLAAMLAFNEAKLGITEQQRPAWKKLGESLKAAAEPVRRACAENAQPATSLPARLEHWQKMSEAHAAALKLAVPAIEQFYNTLTPDQKKIADEQLAHGFGMGHRHGGHGHHR